jgi:hypothetical protein
MPCFHAHTALVKILRSRRPPSASLECAFTGMQQARVLIRDLPADATDLSLEGFLAELSARAQLPAPIAVCVKHDRVTGACRGFAFVECGTPGAAEACVAAVSEAALLLPPLLFAGHAVLRAEVATAGASAHARQRKSKSRRRKAKQKSGAAAENQRDLGRFRSRRGPSQKKHPKSTTRSDQRTKK